MSDVQFSDALGTRTALIRSRYWLENSLEVTPKIESSISQSLEPESQPGCQILRLPMRQNHGWVILIDEIDKAESDVPNGLLEALGSGGFTPLGCTEPVEMSTPVRT